MNAALKNLSASVFGALYIACWMIWKCKNKVASNNIAPSYKDLWSLADLYRMEFLEVQQKKYAGRQFDNSEVESSSVRLCS